MGYPPRAPRRYSRDRSPPRRRYSRSPERSPAPRRRYSRERRSPAPVRRFNREPVPPCKVIGVFGLSLRTTERDLEEVFNQFGKIEQITLVHDKDRRSRGFGFINYSTISEAEEAVKKASGTLMDGREIRVDFSATKKPHTPTPGEYRGRVSYRDRSPPRRRRYSRSPPRRYNDRRRDDDREYNRRRSPRRYSRSPPRRRMSVSPRRERSRSR
ncbi:RNA recognition motif domain-containing protein [Rozella allomycis CSF55]|uniref:RNA recognition motif domain-containing protein n=1 Tax=Rozella allomycis (strain CSF55) TaxID=988480 RepID=A0A075API6_ROZAC|nr:RNA recognition motif domain-containing protein [Rozella allomycis CSF55]|eukprot:EPZ32016.1 RNA recognition motif domain-containing protein [Rozella allomycis CSF55]